MAFHKVQGKADQQPTRSREKKIVCCVTMDVEVDKDPQYLISNPPCFRNVTEAIPKILEPLFLEYGVRPTYLISSEVMQDHACVKVFESLKSDHELGTHGHAELLEELDITKFSGRPMVEFINDYSYEVQLSKLSWLTELFIETFGYAPKSFRGGRFGVDGATLRVLEKLGYAVDSSVAPGIYCDNSKQVLNYIKAPEQPYRPAASDVTGRGDLGIWEVPVSCWPANRASQFSQSFFAAYKKAGYRLPKIIERVVRKTTGGLKGLRPTLATPDTLVRWTREFISRHENGGTVILNIMFHPIELIPGASPYALNPAGVEKIANKLRAMIGFIKERQGDFIKLSQVPDYYSLDRLTN